MAEENIQRIPDSGLKMLCSFLIGIVVSGMGAFIAYPHDLPTKADLSTLQSTTQAQLSVLQATQTVEEAEITTLRINIAKISAKLNVPVD